MADQKIATHPVFVPLFQKLFLFLIILLTNSFATTIVLIRNSDGVYLGADSRIVDQYGDSLGIENKVTPMGRYFFAHAGLGRDESFGFDIKAIARTAFENDLALDEQVRLFATSVDREYTTYLGRIKDTRQDVFHRLINGNINIETVVAGRNDSGAPFFQVIKFTAAGSDMTIKIAMPVHYHCPGDCAGDQVVAMVGQMSYGQDYMASNPLDILNDPVNAINFIIHKECEHDHRVGLPVTILKIGMDETQWIQRCDAE